MKILSGKLEITYLLCDSSITVGYEKGLEAGTVTLSTEGEEEVGNKAVFYGFEEIEMILKDFKSKVTKIKLNEL